MRALARILWTLVTVVTGAVQYQRLVGQEQGSNPGVRGAAHAGVQGTARGVLLQGPGRRRSVIQTPK